MKHIALLLALTFVSLTLAACGSDRTVVVEPQPATDHVVVEHAN
jgi:hypothetical protein